MACSTSRILHLLRLCLIWFTNTIKIKDGSLSNCYVLNSANLDACLFRKVDFHVNFLWPFNVYSVYYMCVGWRKRLLLYFIISIKDNALVKNTCERYGGSFADNYCSCGQSNWMNISLSLYYNKNYTCAWHGCLLNANNGHSLSTNN